MNKFKKYIAILTVFATIASVPFSTRTAYGAGTSLLTEAATADTSLRTTDSSMDSSTGEEANASENGGENGSASTGTVDSTIEESNLDSSSNTSSQSPTVQTLPDDADDDSDKLNPDDSTLITDPTAKIHFIALPGSTDAILLESNGHFGMVDSGEDSDYPDGSDSRYPLRSNVFTGAGYEDIVIAYMHSVGVTTENFDFYLGTHPHSDHIGSADEIIREFHPQRVYLMEYDDSFISSPALLYDNQYVYDRAVAAAKEVGSILIQNFDPTAEVIPVQTDISNSSQISNSGTDSRSYTYYSEEEITAKYGEAPLAEEDTTNEDAFPSNGVPILDSSDPNSTVYDTPISTTGNPNFDLGLLHISIMNYSDDYKTNSKPDANYFSLGVKVTTDSGYSAFLGGDITTSDGDEDRLAAVLGHVDVLKLGHHGIANANSLSYLSALSPTIAIQTGYYKVLPNNRSDLLSKMGTRLYSLPYYADQSSIILDMHTLEMNVASDAYKYYVRKDSPYLTCYQNGIKTAYTGFVTVNDAQYYFNNSSTAQESSWISVENNWYHASKTGILDSGWIKSSSKWYYLDPDTMAMVTGHQEIDGQNYYFNTSGSMAADKWIWVGSKCYYFQSNGAMAKSKWIGSYYVDENGVWDTSKNAKSGWISTSGKWRYVHGDKTYTKSDWELISGKWYYFDAKGYMCTGWLKLDGNYYFLKSSGARASEWTKVNGKWYYLDPKSGIMQTGWIILNYKNYYLKSSGAMATGWQKLDNTWYYFNSSGVMQTGWLFIQNKYYFLNEYGVMVTGWFFRSKHTYYFSSSGVMTTGWQTINDRTYYFHLTGGYLCSGWVKFDSSWYYLTNSGTAKTGWLDYNGCKYYLNDDGIMQTGWRRIENSWYYFKSTGIMATGWVHLNNTWYYMNSEGILQTGWLYLSGKTYYLKSSGAMAIEWQKIDNAWFYFKSDGLLATGWTKVGTTWYYTNSDGKMQTGWLTIGSKTYYLNSSGAMLTGRQKISNKWYTFSSSGVLQN